MYKNILEISDQNRINIEVTLLYFSTNQLKTQNKNIIEYFYSVFLADLLKDIKV